MKKATHFPGERLRISVEQEDASLCNRIASKLDERQPLHKFGLSHQFDLSMRDDYDLEFFEFIFL